MKKEDTALLCDYSDLGSPLHPLKTVLFGLIHKMRQLETQKGRFAIKELSKLINFDDEKKKEYELSEEISRKPGKRL